MLNNKPISQLALRAARLTVRPCFAVSFVYAYVAFYTAFCLNASCLLKFFSKSIYFQHSHFSLQNLRTKHNWN